MLCVLARFTSLSAEWKCCILDVFGEALSNLSILMSEVGGSLDYFAPLPLLLDDFIRSFDVLLFCMRLEIKKLLEKLN